MLARHEYRNCGGDLYGGNTKPHHVRRTTRFSPVSITEMTNDTFDILFLIARPAAGKSEIIDYLKHSDEAERRQRFHIGAFDEIGLPPELLRAVIERPASAIAQVPGSKPSAVTGSPTASAKRSSSRATQAE